MTQRLLDGRVFDLFRAPGAEGAARRGEKNARGRVCIAGAQTLEDGAMLAVHGQKRLPGLARGFRHQRAARDERFLVGQQHALARAERVHHGGQPCETHDRNEHVVRFGKRS